MFNLNLTLRKTPPPAPPRNGEGSFSVTPPALSGKGDGGLGVSLNLKNPHAVSIPGAAVRVR